MRTRAAIAAGRAPAPEPARLSPSGASSARAEATVGSGSGAGLPGNYAVVTDGNPLGQAAAQGVGGGVGPPPGADLTVEVGDVPLDGVRAQPETAGDLPVGLPRGQEPQHLLLPAAEAVRRRRGPAARARPGRRRLP